MGPESATPFLERVRPVLLLLPGLLTAPVLETWELPPTCGPSAPLRGGADCQLELPDDFLAPRSAPLPDLAARAP